MIRNLITIIRSNQLKRYRGNDFDSLERKIQRYYQSDFAIPYYEKLASRDTWGYIVRRTDFIKYCDKSLFILDYGCGSGNLIVTLRKKYPAKYIIGYDIRRGTDDVFLPKTDMIISRYVVEHTVHPQKYLSEAYEMLMPGGVLYLVYPHLLFKVSLWVTFKEVFSWLTSSERLIYLDPQVDDKTYLGRNRDAVWLSNHIKIMRMMKRVGFRIEKNILSESSIIARKPE